MCCVTSRLVAYARFVNPEVTIADAIAETVPQDAAIASVTKAASVPPTSHVNMDMDTTENPPVPARATRRRPRGRGIRVRTGCSACRFRHLKCDETQPICRACQKASRECIYPPKQHQQESGRRNQSNTAGDERAIASTSQPPEASARSTRNRSAEDEQSQVTSSRGTACNTEATVDQNDSTENLETEKPSTIVEGAHAPDDHSNVTDIPLYSSENAAYLTEEVFGFDDHHSGLEFPDVYDAELFGISPEAFGGWPTVSAEAASQWWLNLLASDITDSQFQVPDHIVPHQRYEATSGICVGDDMVPSVTLIHADDYTQPTTGSANSIVTLSDTEVQLLHHYVLHLSGWIDATDPDRQFAVIVPDLASRDQGLASAILALSSLHLSLDSKPQCSHSSLPIDPTTAVQYYNETLHYLQHAMGNAAFLRSDELLATVLIISMFEMIETKTLGSAWDKHLQGVFWIQRSQVVHGESIGLKKRIWCKSSLFLKDISPVDLANQWRCLLAPSCARFPLEVSPW
jgi:hypothetical protein